jgi:pimeloyl-ACP methyl ester carboxylesterase
MDRAIASLVAGCLALSAASPAVSQTAQPAAGHWGYLLTNGSRIYYEDFGRGPAIILIHDGLAHGEVWEQQVAAFAEHYRVVSYDRRGYGRSDAPTQPYSNIDDLEALLSELDIDNATLIGSSSGGALAINFALTHPGKVDALVLVGAVVNGMGYSSHFVRRGYSLFGPDIQTTVDRMVNDQYHIAPENTAARDRLRELLTKHPRNLEFGKFRLMVEPDFSALERLPEIGVPTLIIGAEADIPDVHVHAGALDAGIAGAARVVIPNAGHLVYLEQPAAFNEAVLEFLSLLSLRLEDRLRRQDRQSSFERGLADVGTTELYYEVMGQGPPLVLIHGGGLDHRMWDDQFEAFARHFRVIRYDAQGHGLSRNRTAVFAAHDDLYRLLRTLKVDKAHVLGLSLGGRIAVDFALAHPEMIRALLPVSPGLSGYQFTSQGMLQNMQRLSEALRAGKIDDAVECMQRSWTDGPARTPDQVDSVVRERVRVMLRGGLDPGKSRGEGKFLDPPALGRLNEINAPTLIILGALDVGDILTIGDHLEDGIDGAEKIVLPGAAHMVNMERPAQFNRIVLEFLKDK